MKSPKELLKEVRESKGYTQSQVADAIGIGLRMYQKYEDGQFPRLKTDPVRKIDSFLGTNIYELLYGENIYIYSSEASHPEMSFVEKRRNQKQNVTYTAPLMPAKAVAGYVSSYDQMQFLETLEKYALPPGISHLGANWAYWEISGESMEPTFKNGDMILCSMVPQVDWDHLRNFYTYVIVTDANLWIKRVVAEDPEEWILISDNESHTSPFTVKSKDVKQVWVFRRHIKRDAAINKTFDLEKIKKNLKKN